MEAINEVGLLHKIAAKSFYNYIFNNPNYFINYQKLICNLSEDQKKFIDLTIMRGLHLHSSQYEILADYTPEELLEQLELEKNFESKVINKDGYFQYEDYKLSTNFFEAAVFYYKFNFDKLITKDNVVGTDIIDAGAFCGDSALVFSKTYKPASVHSFEPDDKCHDLLLQTLQLNADIKNIIPIKFGLGEKAETKRLYSHGAASSIMLAEMQNANISSQIEITTIDEYAEKNNLNVGLIKIDVEGFDIETLKGAKNTIRKFKPIIIGSIYHHAPQFFEFKSVIEEWNLGYKFYFDKLNPSRFLNEIMIFCEVY